MSASILDGNAIAKSIRESIKNQVAIIKEKNPEFHPRLVVIQVGDRPDSSTYVRMKGKAAEDAGITFSLEKFSDSITQSDILNRVRALNDDPLVHGLLVQLPLPLHMEEKVITDAVAVNKDVDGFHPTNIGLLTKRNTQPFFIPCTPRGIMRLLDEAKVDLTGKKAVVVGRSDIVGTPIATLLLNADATVTICHSKTQNLETIIKDADVLVVAIGKAQFIKGSWIKSGAVVIDVGTNFIEDKSKKSGHRLVGDVDFDSASKVASYITPVPGGVGPMTVAMLMQNTLDSAERLLNQGTRN